MSRVGFESTAEFVSRLRALDVHLSLVQDKLNCSAPKGVLTNELKAELVRRKPEIIEILRRQSSGKHSPLAEIVPFFRTGDLPLTHAQERLWFLSQYEGGTSAYCIPVPLRLEGDLDRPALESALLRILERHEVLRTGYRSLNGRPDAFIGRADGWKVEYEELPDTGTAEERHRRLDRAMLEFAQRPLDISSPPLIRAKLFKVGVDVHVLLLQVHHIAADGWSISILAEELLVLYPAILSQTPAALPELPIQFVDYAAWHASTFGQDTLNDEIAWWKRQLSGTLPVLELLSDRVRPPLLTFNGARDRFVLPGELQDRLRQFTQSSGTTLFMVLLAAFKVTLHRYTDITDLLVGSATAGRNHPDVEKLIGVFINNLVLRTSLAGDPPVHELLNRIRETTLSAFAHADVPFDKLVTAIQPERDLNHAPLVQVMFTLQNFPFRRAPMGGVEMSIQRFDPRIARFDLTVEAYEMDGRLFFEFEYNTDLFEAATIERFQAHFFRILEGLVANLEQRVSEIPMLTEEERASLLDGAMPDQRAFPPACVQELIARQAASAPDRIAVACGDERLTYAELMGKSSALARHLQSLGVGPGVLVAIALDRSVLMPVALLGVLQAGGAYVPLDPQYPAERLAYMLEDSRAAVLVTETALNGTIPVGGAAVVCLDGYDAQPGAVCEPAKVGHGDVAYVIYTSGSTGKPKGVQVGHGALVNFLESMRTEPGIQKDDRLLAVTTLCFDIAGLEMYLPLVAGAQIEIATRSATLDPARLAATLEAADITMMQATPATWRMLLDSGWRGRAGLKASAFKALCGGEALPRDLANRLLDAGCDLWNLYGPTETTIWSTVFHVTATVEGALPIGKPIANTSVYVLDARQQLVPTGVAGELYLGGAGVAQGYLNRPELTAEKFIESPFAAGEQLYRTGDLVRRRRDGTLEYLGRLDHQVKVRGFRIELGEIEAALAVLPGVRQSVVVADGTDSNARLIAYIASGNERPQIEQLRSGLSRTLPEYMVPAAFVLLPALPMTPNGKIDRKALPKAQFPVASSYLAPRNAAESEIARIWRELLKLDHVGVHENFFDLGGHSLLVVQLQSRLRERFGCEIPLVELFQKPTVASMAVCFENQQMSLVARG
jgi:amino acid adenylation domain-containing protein